MIFIAGISPKIITLEGKPRLCPVCGLAQAYFKRVDHWFSFFLIPILRVKKGEPFIMCEKCERNIHEMGDEYSRWVERQGKKCGHCGSSLHGDFIFCPFCGKKA